MKRAAQKGHVTFDRFSAGKTADSLIHHSLEDGGRKILLGGSLIDQRLNVSLCEYTAACGERNAVFARSSMPLALVCKRSAI